MSSLRSYGPLARLIATPGFQTGDTKKVSATVNQIDSELKGKGQEKVPFLMEKEESNSKKNLTHYMIHLMKNLNIIADKVVLEKLFHF